MSWGKSTTESKQICIIPELMLFLVFLSFFYSRGHQTTARGPNPARKAISSGPRRHFANEEKQYNKGKFVDLAKTFPETITFCKMSGPRTVE